MNRFQVTDEPFTFKEAVEEAKRCLNCKVPQCVKGCPIGNDIPGFIHQLSKGNIGSAMRIINETSNLPAICGRVCPHEKQCQGHCIYNKKGEEPIKIGKIESFIADFDTNMQLTHEQIPPKTRGRVAVIGSGPAGLTVAGDLARKGFSVTIFEGEPEPGGVLLYGIPEYRLPNSVVRSEIEKIRELGVEFRTNALVGVDGLTIDSLFADGFDAIFIGTGTALPQDVDTEGRKLHGVTQSVYLLHQAAAFNDGAITKRHVPVREGEKVGVIGGGNVAMDAARTSLRFGADVTVIYRRGEEDMSANRIEIDEARKEGVKFMFHTSVKRFIGDDRNRLTGALLETSDGEMIEKFDRIFLAIGSRPANRIVSTTEGIDIDEKGYVITVDRPYGMTTRQGVFAGGDVVHRPQTVVLAMKAAKQVATGIAEYVDAVKLLQHINAL